MEPTNHPARTLPHQRNLRGGRIVEDFASYFITKCIDGRRPLLEHAEVASRLIEAIAFQRQKHRIALLAFCVMPDHYHLLCVPLGGIQLAEIEASINKFTASEVNRLLQPGGQVWQRGYHEHRCRDKRDAEDLLLYTEHNPVRKGLVNLAADWPHSSASPTHAAMLDRRWFQDA